MVRLRPVVVVAALAAIACGSSGGSPAPLPAPDVWIAGLKTNVSCALDCNPACTEAKTPWVCPAMDSWGNLPHDPTMCGSFDGKTEPTPVKGQCFATAPTGAALTKTTSTGTPVVLPDGRRLEPAGNEWVLNEYPGGFPDDAFMVPGTEWLLLVDTGYNTQSVRAIDTSILRAGATTTPVVSSISFPPPSALNWGMAFVAPESLLYVASGIPDSKIYAFDFDVFTGALTQDAAKTIALPAGTFPQAVAVSADAQTMLVGLADGSNDVMVVSLASTTYGKVTGMIDLGADDVFEIRFDPNDTTGATAYATMWRAPVDLSMPDVMRVEQMNVPALTATTIAVDKAPEDMLFLNARYMLVATALSDELTIIDRPAAKVVATVSVDGIGLEPTALAYDATNARVYATLASSNGVAVFDVDTTATPPTLTRIGTIPTGWWPTTVTVDSNDGTIYVATGRGHGIKGVTMGGDNGLGLAGSIASIPFMDTTALAAATATHDADVDVQGMAGNSTVSCNGAPYDFPIPANVTDGPSDQIKHVVFIVRENKTFDGLFGDLPGVDGDPSYILSPAYQHQLWQNARSWATTFSHMDNFYEDAEQSIQGHFWTVFGRTSDLDERRWIVTWGRGEFSAEESPGVGDNDAPIEGSIFSSLQSQGVTVDNMGELIGGLAYRDTQWPGGSTNSTIPDTTGACFIAARDRVLCNPLQFTYAWLYNDHTMGLAAGAPNPSLMIAVNDEATGMTLDAISHSPTWKDTLVVVVEDDPSDGLDHVDQHRTIALFASPWVKRGYVSHAHYDMSSIHKLFAHVFGKPYRNQQIANAALPLDMFTSTPDYTPFDYIPRTYSDLSCNPSGTVGAATAAKWDFTEPDDQPGLDQQVRETLRAQK